jgi:hypothetical protein
MKARDLFFGLVACAVAAVVAGCASSAPDQKIQRKEALLGTCGFKVVNAATPQQLQQMRMLPPDRISVVNRGGTRYYVYPDPARKVLYVGNDAQYQAYANQRSNMEEVKQYDSFSKRDPSLAKYENEAELLSGTEYSAGWDQAFGSWDAQ